MPHAGRDIVLSELLDMHRAPTPENPPPAANRNSTSASHNRSAPELSVGDTPGASPSTSSESARQPFECTGLREHV